MASAQESNGLDVTAWRAAPRERGTFNILTSCLLTLNICVYTALHLNVPEKRISNRGLLLRKLKWVLVGVLAPEVLLFNAWSQWRGARDLLAQFKAEAKKNSFPIKNWTMSDSFFTNMGGFVIETEPKHPEQREFLRGSPTLTLSSKGVLFLAQHGLLPDVRRGFIDDKSKADFLGKSLAILQALWIVIQCIGRLVARLPLTLLEIITLGHVFCALVMYSFWWHKPLDIKTPWAIVHPQIRQMAAYLTYDSDFIQRSRHSSRNRGPDGSLQSHPTDEELRNVHHEIFQEAASQFGSTMSSKESGMISWSNPNWDTGSIGHFLSLITTVKGDESDPLATSSELRAWLAFSFLSSCYGGLHVAAWFSAFPTPSEALMWRLSSVCVTSAGLVLGGLGQLFNPVEFLMNVRDCGPRTLQALIWCLNVLLFLSYIGLSYGFLVAYGCSRVFLIIEAFISLRRLPVTAYSTPDWTSLIPHL